MPAPKQAAKKTSKQASKKTSKQALKKAPKKAPKKTSPRAAKEIVQFAPNFTAYVLPPATICLYSEHRKFFLHGKLYVAIAEAIGKNGKETQGLIAELSRKYPVDQIQEGLKRLYERRYVTIASPVTTGTVAGFWASLGLPPGAAENALANCSVRVDAIDVKGAKELASASSPARLISPSRWSMTTLSVASPS
jgi:ribosomal protein S12 methylthiotransferase accessory factor